MGPKNCKPSTASEPARRRIIIKKTATGGFLVITTKLFHWIWSRARTYLEFNTLSTGGGSLVYSLSLTGGWAGTFALCVWIRGHTLRQSAFSSKVFFRYHPSRKLNLQRVYIGVNKKQVTLAMHELNHIAVFDDIFFPFSPKLALITGGRFWAAVY